MRLTKTELIKRLMAVQAKRKKQAETEIYKYKYDRITKRIRGNAQ